MTFDTFQKKTANANPVQTSQTAATATCESANYGTNQYGMTKNPANDGRLRFRALGGVHQDGEVPELKTLFLPVPFA